MINSEKVIKEFELFIKEFHPACTSEGVELDMLREVLALLKEQDNMISIKAVSDFLAEYALPPTLQRQNLFSFNGNMASEWERFLRDLKGW